MKRLIIILLLIASPVQAEKIDRLGKWEKKFGKEARALKELLTEDEWETAAAATQEIILLYHGYQININYHLIIMIQ